MVIRELKTASEVIDALGGTAECGRLVNRKDNAVSNWRASGRIPPDFYLIMTRALVVKQCSAPASLWGIREPQEGVAAS